MYSRRDSIHSAISSFAILGAATALAVSMSIGAALAESSPTSSHMTAAKTVFTANCEVCHGADGTGSNPTGKALNAANLTSANVQKQSNVQLARFISEGRGAMPSFKSQLTHRQIMNQVQYIRSLAKEKK